MPELDLDAVRDSEASVCLLGIRDGPGAEATTMMRLRDLATLLLTGPCIALCGCEAASRPGGDGAAALPDAGSDSAVPNAVAGTGGHTPSIDETAGRAGAAGATSAPCPLGTADCDGDPNNGCETDTLGDVSNCGACGAPCGAQNATAACVSGSCELVCDPGFEDCNSTTSDGCEVAVFSDVDNCGGCGIACAVLNAAALACDGGACRIEACEVGFADCDESHDTGCEIDLEEDGLNCGWCGHDCGRSGIELLACTGGVCAPGTETPTTLAGVPQRTRIALYAGRYYFMVTVVGETSLWRTTGSGDFEVVWTGVSDNGVTESVASDSDGLFWSTVEGDIFRIDATSPNGLYLATRAGTTPTRLSVSGNRLVWIENGDVVVADREAVVLTVESGVDAVDVLAHDTAQYFATTTSVYQTSTQPVEFGTSDGVARLAYADDGGLFWWTATDESAAGVIRNGVSGDREIPVPEPGVLGLVAHAGYVYWVTASGGAYRAPYTAGSAAEVQHLAEGPNAFSNPLVNNGRLYWKTERMMQYTLL